MLTQPTVRALPATATPSSVPTLPATATPPAVRADPATATPPQVRALPATATLLLVATLPATKTPPGESTPAEYREGLAHVLIGHQILVPDRSRGQMACTGFSNGDAHLAICLAAVMRQAASPPRAPELPEALERDEIATLAHDASLGEIELRGLSLAGQHAKGVTLNTVRLSNCDLADSQMEHLRILDGALGDCNLANLQARGATFTRVAIERGRLTGIDLAEAMLCDVAFRDCRIDLASFRGARLERVTFSDCVLAQTDFLHTRLDSVRFHDCDLTGADLRGAQLKTCELRRNELTGLQGVESLRGAALEWSDIVEMAAVWAAALGIEVLDDED